MEILERGPLLIDLSGLLYDVGRTGGRVVLLSGEAGVGKTVLIRRLGEMVANSCRVLQGACDPLTTPRPLAPVRDIAEQLGPKWTGLVDSGPSREQVFSAFLRELTDGSGPTLVLFEDVHWADDATLDLLRFLARRIDTTRSVLIATYRDDELADGHPLRAVLGDLATSASVLRKTVPPLSLSGVSRLAQGSGLNPAVLHHLTGGNPFFVTEVLAAGSDGIPPTVRDAVLTRAAKLDASERAVLQAAAVIGSRIEPELLRAVAEEDLDSLDACIDIGMLRIDGHGFAFRHELTRETLYETINPARRTALHRSVLGALKAGIVGDRDPARLAHHAEGAGDAEAVLEFAPIAAARAAELSAHREAAAQYARALRFAGRLSDPERAALLEPYSFQSATADRHEDSVRADREIIEIWRREGNRLKEGWAHSYLASCLTSLGRNAEAEEASRASIEILETLTPGLELAYAYVAQAGIRMLNRDSAEAIEWARKALDVIETSEHGDPDEEVKIRVLAYNRMGSAMLVSGDDRGREYLERCRDLGYQLGRPLWVGMTYSTLGSAYGEWYRFPEAVEYLETGIDYAAEHEIDFHYTYSMSWLALCLVHLGRWDEAETAGQTVISRRTTSTIGRIMATLAIGRLLTRRGDAEGARYLDQALELALPTATLQRLGPVHAARAEAAWLAGDPERVAREARSGLALALEREHPWIGGELLFWLSMSGEPVTAPNWVARPFALQIERKWREAAAEWRRLGCPYEEARALAESDSVGDLRAAHETFERLGAEADALATTRALRRIGERGIRLGPRASTRENPANLTNRQVQVIRLVAKGLPNPEIADRLYISPRTVDHHVSAALGKLGVRTRMEAAREAERLGLLEK